jgi:two-component system, NarL family, response regulator NreC
MIEEPQAAPPPMNHPAIPDGSRWPGLTRTETRVARMLVAGAERLEIAVALEIDPKTYDTHRMHVLRKLRVRSVVDLTRLALVEGWVTLERPPLWNWDADE